MKSTNVAAHCKAYGRQIATQLWNAIPVAKRIELQAKIQQRQVTRGLSGSSHQSRFNHVQGSLTSAVRQSIYKRSL